LSANHIITICGDSGSGKSTLANEISSVLLDSIIFECDRYHKWERGDYHWNHFSHLDPLANNIDQMKADLLILESNKPIRQRDYDHSVGRFTNYSEIAPKKYIIACGLHSYCFDPKNGVKIFVDTENDLKCIWKLNRDFFKRGHKIESILQKIEQRRSDYENHIKPQINKSDIILKVENQFNSGVVSSLHIHNKFSDAFEDKKTSTYKNFFSIDRYNVCASLLKILEK